jgi:two-component system, NarL family, sensor histidine kinase YdfH
MMKPPQAAFSKPDRDYRIFFLFMTLVIGAVYVSTLMSDESLRETWKLAPFTLLICLHIALHWLLEKIAGRGWTVAYILVQGLLAFVIVNMANSVTMLFCLYMALMGEIAGLLGLNRKALLAILYFLALSVVNFLSVTGAGTAGWWALAIIPGTIFSIMYTTMYVRQSQARERAQELLKDLETANHQLSAYAAQVEDLTIAAERQRLARELHDTLSQGLAGLILQLEAADAHLAGGRPERVREILQQSMQKARGTLAEARKAIDDLRQARGRSLGVAARQEAEHFTTSTGIPCQVDISFTGELPENIAETAIRVVTESLTNIARHAKAHKAGLRIVELPASQELEIEISDDGMGFDPEAIQTGHYGLLGMRERVRLAGGSWSVASEVGKGTSIVIRFPLEAHVET